MKKNMLLLLSTCFIIGLVSGCTPSNTKYADLVVYNTIYTAEKENGSFMEAFAVKDGKYIYVGTSKDDQLRTTGSTNIINTYFEGQCVYSSSKAENS